MTIEELRVLVEDLVIKTTVLNQAARELQSFLSQIQAAIAPENPFAGIINIDQLVAIQTPIYLQLLTAIETAADALGSDPLH